MKPILFEAGATQFGTNGLGRLSDAINCAVTEARNGAYELSMTYPLGGIHFDDIREGRVIYAYNDDAKEPQPFDIYSISKPSFGNITVKARHVCYRLSGYVVKPWFTQEGETFTGQEALDMIRYRIIGNNIFTFVSDITTKQEIIVPTVPVTAWALFGDQTENSLLSWFDGEYEYDHFTVSFLTARGSDKGTKIRRGKNVTGLTISSSIEDKITSIVPYWQGTDLSTGNDLIVTLPVTGTDGYGVVYASGYSASSPDLVTKPVDFSDSFETAPTTAQLQAAAEEWLRRNTYNTSNNVNYSISIAKDKETEALNKLQLCDTVTVEDQVLGIRTKLKVVSLTYDVLAERVTAIQLGSPRRSLSLSLRYPSATAAANGVTERGTASGNASGTSSAKQTTVNAAKIKALEKAIASGGGGGGGGSGSGESIYIDSRSEAYDASSSLAIVRIKDETADTTTWSRLFIPAQWINVPSIDECKAMATAKSTTLAQIRFDIPIRYIIRKTSSTSLLPQANELSGVPVVRAYWVEDTTNGNYIQLQSGNGWYFTARDGYSPYGIYMCHAAFTKSTIKPQSGASSWKWS